MVHGSSTPARIRPRTWPRVCRSSTTLSTPCRCSISPSNSPAGPPPMMATWVRNSARAGDAARLQERCQRLAAERRDHLRVRDAFGARELLEAEKARAVVLHRLPVQAPHHVALFRGQVFHCGIRVAPEELAHLLARKAVQEAVKPQASRAALEIEDVLTQRARPPWRWSSAGSNCGA